MNIQRKTTFKKEFIPVLHTAALFTDETISRLLGYPVTIVKDAQQRLHIELKARSDVSALLYGGDRS